MTMTIHELEILHTHLDTATNYLEYGSGASTIYACQRENIHRIVSVESSQQFVDEYLLVNQTISEAVNAGKLDFHVVDIGNTKNWGKPVNNEKKHLWPNYVLSPFATHNAYDLVLIDGRFRIASALNALLSSQLGTPVLIHDFWNRKHYNLLLNFADIVERADTMVVLKMSNTIKRTKMQSLIKRYQYLPKDKYLPHSIMSYAWSFLRN